MRFFLITIFLAVVTLSGAAQAKQTTFTGTITDSECGSAGHARMQMGPTDAECTRACIDAHGASYVLLVGKTVYTLSDQTTPAQFAGQRVTVTGTLDEKSKTIRVSAIKRN